MIRCWTQSGVPALKKNLLLLVERDFLAGFTAGSGKGYTLLWVVKDQPRTLTRPLAGTPAISRDTSNSMNDRMNRKSTSSRAAINRNCASSSL
jgi:hypothetical protein